MKISSEKPQKIYAEINGRKYTNNFNLPKEICDAILKDRYSVDGEEPSDYSATTIIAPIQQTILKRRHKNNLKVQDITGLSWAFFGAVCHSRIEEASDNGAGLTEKRLYATLLGKTISGKMDRYIDGEIKDWKFTKVYKWQKKDFTDWENQMAVLTYLLRINGYPVNKISITMHLRDWTEANSYNKGYPDCKWQVVPIPVWSQEKCEEYIKSRLEALRAAEELTPKGSSCHNLAQYFPCSDKECWRNVKDYSILKIGADRATKCFDTQEEAEAYFQEKQMDFDKYVIEKRMTERKRCFKWCDVNLHCQQFKQYLKEKENE